MIEWKKWNGMEWNGMEWNGMEWNGKEWTIRRGRMDLGKFFLSRRNSCFWTVGSSIKPCRRNALDEFGPIPLQQQQAKAQRAAPGMLGAAQAAGVARHFSRRMGA